MTQGFAGLILSFLVLGMAAAAQQPTRKRANELVAGKLVYVAPMPGGLDQWILDYLRRWGKYKVTGNSEGVDLVVQAYNPEKELELKERGGVAIPKDEDRKFPQLPRREKKGKEEPAALAVSVYDWVTNERLWHADILDRKQQKNDPDPPAGPETRIFARGMTSDQLGQKIVQRLQEYVGELEKAGSRP